MAIRKMVDAERIANPIRTRVTSYRADGKGPWFQASYDGECSSCWGPFIQGWEIRADGQGGWEGRKCCNDDEE
jgi:hypothetical protein